MSGLVPLLQGPGMRQIGDRDPARPRSDMPYVATGSSAHPGGRAAGQDSDADVIIGPGFVIETFARLHCGRVRTFCS